MNQEIPSQEEQQTGLELATLAPMSRVPYTAVTTIASLGLLELFGAGPFGLVGAGVAGLAAWFFSEDIRALVRHVVPTSVSTHRLLAGIDMGEMKHRLLYGADTPRHYARIQPQSANTVDGTLAPASTRPFPLYPVNETLRLGRLVTGDMRFDPHMNDLLGQGLIVAGVQGMGKSNIAALVLESASRCDMPAVMFDLKREFHTLVEVAPNAIRAGHESLRGTPGYFVLSEQNTDEFATLVMTNKHQAIIDLQSYGEDLVPACKIMAALLRSLMKWSIALPENAQIPCLTMLDEAQVFLPQNQQLSVLNKETIDDLQRAWYNICNMGRSFGFTVCFFTQSIANLQKWAIKNCQCKVIGRHVEKNDLDRCCEDVNIDVATRQDLMKMAKGTAVVSGFTFDQQLVKFDARVSRHVSNTPKIERLRQPLREQRVHREPVAPYVPPAQPSFTAPVSQATQELSDEQMARIAWDAGNKTVGAIEKASGLSHRQAYKYWMEFSGVPAERSAPVS